MNTDTLCRAIVEGTQEAVIYADRDGRVRFWNAGAEAMFGHSTEEIVGQTLDPIIPERLRSRHAEGYRRVMETGVTRYGRELLAVPALRKDGTRISIEFSVVLIRDADAGIAGIAAIVRDVTARWQREKAAREAAPRA